MRAVVAILLLVVSACASNPDNETRRPMQTARVVDGVGRVTEIPLDATRLSVGITLDLPVERAWPALVAAYKAVGIPITDVDSRAYFIGNRDLRLRGRLGDTRLSRYLDCGHTQGNQSANTYEVHMDVQTRLAPENADTTAIRTTIEATARPSTFAGHDVRCSSTGRLERRIAVEVLVRGTAPKRSDVR